MINYSIDTSLSLENKQNMDNSFWILRFHTVIEKISICHQLSILIKKKSHPFSSYNAIICKTCVAIHN